MRTRLGIQGPACVHELVDDLRLSQPLVSQHLRVLRSVDLVRGTRRGKEIASALADDHVGQLADALAHSAEESPGASDPIDPEPEMEHTPMSTAEHDTHADHAHAHGHATVEHGDHVDYVHGEHRRALHGDHYDEH